MERAARKATPRQNHLGAMRHCCLVSCFILISASTGLGCSCYPVMDTVAGFYDHATSVFQGRVVDISDNIPGGNSTSDGTFVPPGRNEVKTVIVTVSVFQAWKGVDLRPDVTSFMTNLGEGALCGTSFNVGGEYLIYTTGNKGAEWVRGLCGSRFMPLKFAQEDIADLNDIIVAGPTSVDSTEPSTQMVDTTTQPKTPEADMTEAVTTEDNMMNDETTEAATTNAETTEADMMDAETTDATTWEYDTTEANLPESSTRQPSEDRKYLR